MAMVKVGMEKVAGEVEYLRLACSRFTACLRAASI